MTKYSKTLKKHALACMLASAFISNAVAETSTAANGKQSEKQSQKESFIAVHTNNVVNIDGKADESVWQQATWYDMPHDMIGNVPTAEDFSGRFKLAWDKGQLYLLAEIVDDVLFDQYPNPLNLYWDDDCLEIFIDEDKSGGNHQFNFNAFAYHVALDNQAVDIGEQTADNQAPFILLNDHIESRWQRDSTVHKKLIWEVAIKIYDDSFKVGTTDAKPVELKTNKQMGFMLAYCDNDGSKQREHFMGSTKIEAVNGDKNLGYIDASVFSTLTLKPSVKNNN
ncbi:sugar-binding protein [uncultured Psychrosphaera sp.]|uniref:sugar-binding protein n=1 Tax=uncultured Psychrosphaera sp. TaxID=1403522 RepID=UPI002602C16E|nr:sugar-binding protein [uncultured Psychrosphaera sp.]